MAATGVPEVQMAGTGAVVPPATPQQASYDRHYAEFLSRGVGHELAARFAREVVARDTPTAKE